MSNQIEIRHLRYFMAVAEDLHFHKAAERLYISQPGLSRQIKQMENELGLLLFERTSRKVRLTKAGKYLYAEVKHNLQHLEHSFHHAKLIDRGIEGNIKLSYVGSAIQKIIPDLLARFQKEYPNIQYNLNEMDNQKQVDALLNHETDLGFVRLERTPTGLKRIPIHEDSFCLVLPESHPSGGNHFTDISDYRDQSFIMFEPSYSPSYFEKVMQIFDDRGFSPMVSHRTVHSGTIFSLVSNGFGISIVPKSLCVEGYPGIKFLEMDNIPQRSILFAIWNRKNRNPVLLKITKLIEDLKKKKQPDR